MSGTEYVHSGAEKQMLDGRMDGRMEGREGVKEREGLLKRVRE